MIDASAIKSSACGLQLFYTTVEGYRAKGLTSALHWGSSVHKFREVYRTTTNWFLAVKAGIDYWNSEKSLVNENKLYLEKNFLMQAFDKYQAIYPANKDSLTPLMKTDGTPLVEPVTRFAIPYYTSEEVDILLCGTMDEIAWQENTGPFQPAGYRIVDMKTTGAWKIREYFDSYKLSTQLLMYRWAIRAYGKMLPGSIWEKIDKSPTTACVIDGLFYKGSYKDNSEASLQLARSEPITFKEWQLVEFDILLRRQVNKLLAQILQWRKEGTLPMREGIITDSCGGNKYGICAFRKACEAVDDEARISVLTEDFDKKFYNPLQFH